jgi:hypothetical protein
VTLTARGARAATAAAIGSVQATPAFQVRGGGGAHGRLQPVVRVFERLSVWLVAVITGIGSLYLGVTATSDTPTVLVGVFWVLGVGLLTVGVLGFGFEAVGVLRGLFSERPTPGGVVIVDRREQVDNPPPAAMEGEPAPRAFVPGSVTPEYLFAFFEGHTTAQGQRSVSDYIGKWMRLAGPVSNVQVFIRSAVVTFLIQRGSLALFDSVSMWFPEASKETVRLLNVGDEIAVIGRIESVRKGDLQLQDCELA